MATETWIVYKTESMSDRGWSERMLMPEESLTNILEENWSSEQTPTIPQPGDRTRFDISCCALVPGDSAHRRHRLQIF